MQWPFDRFVTLTLNEPGDGTHLSAERTARRMTRLLREWDARMNRKLIGRDWLHRPDNRIFGFYGPEKISANPHWHGLVHFFGADNAERERQSKVFDDNITPIWNRVAPAGTVESVFPADLEGAVSYVAKSLCVGINYNCFILPDSFSRM